MCENLVRIGRGFQELSWVQKRKNSIKNKIKQVKPPSFDPPGSGLTIIKSIWNSGNLPYLVANAYRFQFHQNRRYLNFPGGGRSPQLGVFHVTCDTHFRTQMSYSGQKSCVKIWFGLVEPFKSYHLNFPGEAETPH